MTQLLEVTLNRIRASGDMTGAHPEDGRPILVADAIPGERVLVEIDEKELADPARSTLRGTLRRVQYHYWAPMLTGYGLLALEPGGDPAP